MRDRLLYIAGGLAIVLIAYNLAQTAAQPREALFYIPLAGTAALAAFTALAASLLFLGSRNFQFDSLAVAVTEAGLAFSAASIVNGCFLLHAATGRWWNWDSRLTAALVCWLLYATYLMLRHAVQDPTERAAFSAVWSIFAFLDIPMVAATIKWWRSVSSPVSYTHLDVYKRQGDGRGFRRQAWRNPLRRRLRGAIRPRCAI